MSRPPLRLQPGVPVFMTWARAVASPENLRVAVFTYLVASLVWILLGWAAATVSADPRGALLALATGPLETNPFLSAADVREALRDMGSVGRSILAASLFPEAIYAVLFGAVAFLALTGLLEKLLPARSKAHWLTLLPLAGALADLVEDATLLWILDAHPDVTTGHAVTLGVATFLKLALIGGTIATLLWGAVRMLLRRPKKRTKRPQP